MKAVLVLTVTLLAAIVTASANQVLECQSKAPNVPHDWLDMEKGCVDHVRDQIKEELKASMTYLAMGAYFAKDVVNRPGFAKMFFEAASEEREHANKLISYLLMRGELTKNASNLFKTFISVDKTTWASGLEALKDALRLEAHVTKSIKNVISKCEDSNGVNDYHFADYLTGEFLEEQYRGQRDIAGKVSTLDKIMDQHGALGEFLFDKKLLA